MVNEVLELIKAFAGPLATIFAASIAAYVAYTFAGRLKQQ